MKKFLLVLLASAALAAPPAYKVIDKIKIGGGGRWDYSYVDTANHRLYVSHGTQTEVIDTNTDKLVGTIPGTNGVHGIAIAADLGKGFTSDGGDNDVSVFDLKTLKVTGKIKTGQNPDAIIYEPMSHRVFTFNGRSSDATAIDAKTGDVIAASIPVGGKPEFAQIDGKGHIYANIEDKNEIIEVNAKDALVAKRYSIAPCDSPSGLVIDPKGRLYSVCENKMMIVSDPASGKVLANGSDGRGRRMAWASTMAMRSPRTARMEPSPWWARPRRGSSKRWRPFRRSAARAPLRSIRRRTSCICRARSSVRRRRIVRARRAARRCFRIASW